MPNRLWAILIPKRPGYANDRLIGFEVEKITPKMIWSKDRFRNRYGKDVFNIETFECEEKFKRKKSQLHQVLGVANYAAKTKEWENALNDKRAKMREYAKTTPTNPLPNEWRS